jgi:tetratricopeptide (TPR) repeat protein
LEFLGEALMEQGRYDEAMRSYEAALHAFSWRRRPYRGMAEMLLRQGKKTEQALEWTEKIIDFTGLSTSQRKRNGRPQDDYWALKAWALARLGRRQEAESAIETALKATDKEVIPDLATTYHRVGMAMQALGNEVAARDYFKRAAELDPRGRRGLLAGAAMLAESFVAG